MPSPAADYRELLIGCGHDRTKRMRASDRGDWVNLVTLDMNPDVRPDIEADLDRLPYTWAKDNEYDEIHAYEVLEHLGRQGDWRFWLAQWDEFWRMLKPGGRFLGSIPLINGKDVWADPGHTKVIDPTNFKFLDRAFLSRAVGASTVTDYRRYFRCDFEVFPASLFSPEAPPDMEAFLSFGQSCWFALRAIKPARTP